MLCYIDGQTGSGKTWSMTCADNDNKGVLPRLCSSLFERVDTEKIGHPTMQFLVTASYFEIYNEVIFDLLDSTLKKGKPIYLPIKSYQDILKLLDILCDEKTNDHLSGRLKGCNFGIPSFTNYMPWKNNGN